MKISVQSHPLIMRHGWREALQILRDTGFEAVDFGLSDFAMWDYMVKHEGESIYDSSDSEIASYFAEVGEFARSIGLEIGQTHSPFPNCTFDVPPVVTDFHLRTARVSIAATAALGCGYTVIHPAFCHNGYVYDEMPEMREFTRKLNDQLYIPLIPYLKQYNVKLCIENMWAFYPHTEIICPAVCSHVDEMIDYIDGYNKIAGGEYFCACLDTGHCILTGDDPAKSIVALGDRLQRIHLHDVVKDHDLHQAAYEGIADWDAIAAALKQIDYKGILNFETATFVCRRPEELERPTLELEAATARLIRSKITGQSFSAR